MKKNEKKKTKYEIKREDEWKRKGSENKPKIEAKTQKGKIEVKRITKIF